MISNELNIDSFNELSEEEKKLALKILEEYSKEGTSELLDKLKYADFEEIPVDISTFMHNRNYLGNALYDQEGRFTVFPYWEEKLKEIFPDNVSTRYNTIVFTGAIGLGKSTIAVICLLYLLYRLLCLKDPYLYYGLQPIDKISISLMNITLENAKGVALDKMNQMILASNWFLSHGEMSGTSNLVFRPDKHIEVICASSNNQIIGRAVFCNFTDEVNFGISNDVEKLKKKQKALISQIDARMKSRFLRGTYLPTLNIIASSKNSEQSFLEDFINTKKSNESKTTLIVDEPQWVVDSRKDSPIKFYVAIGNKFLANEVLPLGASEETLEKYRAKGYSLLAVPIGYLDNFLDNIDGALTDIAGIATASSLKYISGERLNLTKTDDYANPFTKDIIEVGNSPTDYLQYANFFDLSRVSPEDMAKPLFIHLDMSISGDKTGIAGVWLTGKSAPNAHKSILERDIAQSQEASFGDEQLMPVSTDDEQARDLRYKLAFSVSVKAPKGYQVSFEKNRNFIRWLRDKGFAIKGISSDTFQSATIMQELKSDGFKTEIISVDRVTKMTGDSGSRGKSICLPYHYLKSAIYEQRIQMYRKCDLLTEELIGLEKSSDGHIDHTAQGINCFVGDTKIKLLNGTDKTIKELVQDCENGVENYVYSFNETTKKIEPNKIKNGWCSGIANSLVEITLDNDEVIKCTPEHKFMLRDGSYKQAKDLCPLEPLMPCESKNQKIIDSVTVAKSIRFIENVNEPVYDIEIENNHNFALTAGIIVHNSKDQADAVCGGLYLASKYAEEYSYNYGDSLVASLNANVEEDGEARKAQLIADFQAELQAFYEDERKRTAEEDAKRREEYQYYQDIVDGIIVI